MRSSRKVKAGTALADAEATVEVRFEAPLVGKLVASKKLSEIPAH